MITYVALPYQAYQLTRSSLMVGLLSAVELVPVVAAALLGGVLADAVDRRLLVRLTEGGRADAGRAAAGGDGRAGPGRTRLTGPPRRPDTRRQRLACPPWPQPGRLHLIIRTDMLIM